MAALESEVVDPKQLPGIVEYCFTGNTGTVFNKRAFIEQLRLKGAVYPACRVIGIGRTTAYRWYEEDPEFARAWEDSLEDAADVMETSVYEDALGTEEKPGNALLKMFWLKAHRPKYRDRVSVDVEVVRTEIEERMSQLNLRQLPAAVMTEMVMNPANTQQFSSLPADLQKEDQSE